MFGAVSRWLLWKEPRRAIVVVLVAVIAAVMVPLTQLGPITRSELGTAALLVSLSAAYSRVTVTWERTRQALRHRNPPTIYTNLLSIWEFAAVVALPLPLAAAVIVVATAAEWPARNLDGRAQPHRFVYGAAGAMLGAVAAHECVGLGLPDYLNIVLAVICYTVVGIAAVSLAAITTGHARAVRTLLQPSTYRSEACCLALALAQVAMVRWQVPLAWLSLPAAVALQRYTVRADPRSEVQRPMTPMRTRPWLAVAREVVLACQVVSIMRIETTDPGAASVIAQVQVGCDAIGSMGRSGLAILLVDCPPINAEALAVRTRSALREKQIEAVVAVASAPRDGRSLADLLAVSEAELITRAAASHR